MRTGVDFRHFLDDRRLVMTAAEILARGDAAADQVEQEDGLPDPQPGQRYDAEGRPVGG